MCTFFGTHSMLMKYHPSFDQHQLGQRWKPYPNWINFSLFVESLNLGSKESSQSFCIDGKWSSVWMENKDRIGKSKQRISQWNSSPCFHLSQLLNWILSLVSVKYTNILIVSYLFFFNLVSCSVTYYQEIPYQYRVLWLNRLKINILKSILIYLYYT